MRGGRTKKIALMGIMLSLVLTLSFLERLIPPLPMMPPGVNLGLSNIIIMYCAFFVGGKWAFGIAAIKSFFVALTRGFTASFLSLSGGLLSVLVITLLILLNRRKISYVAVSICGAVAHNFGQLLAASVILSTSVFFYVPLLIVSGVVMGSVTGITLSVLLPIIHNTIGADWGK